MTPEESEKFQENLIKVMIAMERTFFTLASTCKQNCIVICDRGIMDATAYMAKESWGRLLKSNGWNAVELRDNRYNQIIHLVTSADGAESYYNCEDNPCRTEGLELARELDRRTAEAWVGHPYIDVLDNSTDFDTKMRKMISAVCRRIGLQAGDRLKSASRKVKFLVRPPLPPDAAFPSYQDFDVVHDYLITANPKIQSRLRKRGQAGNWSYQHTVRRSADAAAGSQLVELRRQISHRDYVVSLVGEVDFVNLLILIFTSGADDAGPTKRQPPHCLQGPALLPLAADLFSAGHLQAAVQQSLHWPGHPRDLYDSQSGRTRTSAISLHCPRGDARYGV